MNILRRASTTRLLAGIVVVAVLSVATAYAVSHRGGPRPPRRTLAQAIHHAMAAKPVQGVTARVSFTDHLFPSGSLGQTGGSPILSGATGRLWLSGGKLRIELQSPNGDTEIGAGPSGLVVYDVATGTAYELPADAHPAAAPSHEHAGAQGIPSVAEIQRAIRRLAGRVSLSGAIPGDVAGQPAYTVRISPRHAGGLLGAVQLAWDANHGVPLDIGVYSQGSKDPVLALRVTDISYSRVAASDLAVPMASGTKVVKVRPPAHTSSASATHDAPVTGVAAVARALPFRLAAPPSLVGVPRRDVRLVDWAGTPAALAVYGKGLGAIAVLEQRLGKKAASPLSSLPRISINGADGHELATALGTVLQFDRGGVRYTVLGSLPAAAAEAAARDIR
jgi:hypothetical protein